MAASLIDCSSDPAMLEMEKGAGIHERKGAGKQTRMSFHLYHGYWLRISKYSICITRDFVKDGLTALRVSLFFRHLKGRWGNCEIALLATEQMKNCHPNSVKLLTANLVSEVPHTLHLQHMALCYACICCCRREQLTPRKSTWKQSRHYSAPAPLLLLPTCASDSSLIVMP